MRLLRKDRIEKFAAAFSDARKPLAAWVQTSERATWKSFFEVKQTYAYADFVKLKSGIVVTIFDIKGNHYRLLVSIDYQIGVINILDFLTHAEYSKDKWKDRL